VDTFTNWLGGLAIPFMILLVALAFILTLRFIASRYKKIPPNAVGIFYGRKYSYKDAVTGQVQTQGFRVIGGGGRILFPFVESYQEMSTAAFQTEIDEKGIPNKDNVQINVKGVATCKLSTIPEDLINAVKSFLGKKDDEIKVFVQNILKAICARSSANSISLAYCASAMPSTSRWSPNLRKSPSASACKSSRW
jgi:uncharacterized membrane protein YqiK